MKLKMKKGNNYDDNLLMKIKLKQVKSEEVYRKQDIRKTKIKKYIIKVDLFYIV